MTAKLLILLAGGLGPPFFYLQHIENMELYPYIIGLVYLSDVLREYLQLSRGARTRCSALCTVYRRATQR